MKPHEYHEILKRLMQSKTYKKIKCIVYFTDKYDSDFYCAMYCTDEDFEKVKGMFHDKPRR